jgi:psiF repeat
MRCPRLAVAIVGLTLATAPLAWAATAGQAAAPAKPAATATSPQTPPPAAAKPHTPNAQQDKMAACNKDAAAHQLKGTERKTFMKECLSTGAPAASQKLTAQQEKMKSCNADAATKKLKGTERKTFMSECLKK